MIQIFLEGSHFFQKAKFIENTLKIRNFQMSSIWKYDTDTFQNFVTSSFGQALPT